MRYLCSCLGVLNLLIHLSSGESSDLLEPLRTNQPQKVSTHVPLRDTFEFQPFAEETLGPWSTETKAFSDELGKLLVEQTRNRDGSKSTPRNCTERACVIRAGRILEAIDTQKNPCTEFADFACGGMFRSDQNLGLNSTRSNVERQSGLIQDKLNRVFGDKDRQWTPGAPETKAQKFYENCKRYWFKEPHARELLDTMALALGVPELYQRPHRDLRDTPTPPKTYGGALRVLREQFGFRFVPNLLRTQVDGKCFHMVNNGKITAIGTDMDLASIDFYTTLEDLQDMQNFQSNFQLAFHDRLVCKNEEDIKFNDTTLGNLIEQNPEFGWPEFLNLQQNDTIVEVTPCIPDMARHLSALWNTHPLITKKFMIASAMKNLWTRLDAEGANTQCYKMMKRYFIEVTTALVLNTKKIPDVSQVSRMGRQMQGVLKERFRKAEWLGSAARGTFIEKLEALRFHFGYPDVVENSADMYQFHSTLELTGRLPKDLTRVAQWREQMSASRCDLDIWDQYIHPLTPNALNAPHLQSVAVSLGIIRSDAYDQRVPSMLNYAGIGSTIGHEIMHSFDNSGRLMDRWMNDIEFEENTKKYLEDGEQCLIDYYSSIERKGVKVDGAKTLGENIADIYGLELAYDAWREEVQMYGEDPKLPGVSYTPDQLFFIAFAQRCCEDPNADRLEAYKKDVHSPGYARVIGSVVQTYMFKDAFDCSKDEEYDEKARCALW